ncbi:hypothetical protein MMC12_001366 [Toensbergia leucococca]|nr:hypothetical protein [Toensbergia leucococca]
MNSSSVLSSMSYPSAPARQLYSSNYGTSFSDEAIDQFNMQSQQYLIPSQDAPTSTYGMQDMSRNWTSMAGTNRLPQSGLSFGQDGNSRYSASTLPYLNPSIQAGAVVTADGIFPGMTSLATSLPVPVPNSDRVLPHPAAKRGSLSGGGNTTQGSLGEFSSHGLPLNVGYRSTMQWSPEITAPGVGQGTRGSTSLGTNNGMGASSSKSSSPRPSQESAFGYIPMSQSPPPDPPARVSDYSSANGLKSAPPMEGHLNSADSGFHSGMSTDSLLSSHNSSSNLYSYSMGGATSGGSISDPSAASDGTLVSGQPYTRLRQSQPQQTTSFDALRKDSLEAISRTAHRASISSVNNARRY